MSSIPRFQILFHPQLRTSLPRTVQRDLRSRLFTRLKTQNAFRAAPETNARNAPAQHAKTTIRRGPPERILIYSGGTGKTMFLSMLRLTTVFLFGVSCVVVAPGFDGPEFPWYLPAAIIVGGSLPMLFVAYTAAPYVNFVHLALPVFARRSREQAIQYAKNLPPTATLYINTMRFTTIPRQTEVQLGDLVRDRKLFRPITFRNTNPKPVPWWQGRPLREFYADEKI
ncbi:hypothetical protein HFD88_000440 [Aspergillus terreus]|nr:hypothetical protein HFD88_000440 [Aspergillus terreus]